jgi:hypothetical protein
MKGLELSKAYYREYGMPMLQEKFPELLPFVAVGVFGSGSECFGYDDDISRDHDFDPGFVILLPDEDSVDRKAAFALERAYAALPKEFAGVEKPALAPVGGSRRGVMRMSEFLLQKTGTPDGNLSTAQWLTLPSQSLAEVVNGELFHDGSGEFTEIRRRLAYYPEDVRRKKLAGHLLLAAQAGQYNYGRCLLHGETASAQLAVFAFVESVTEIVFALNRVYAPYYKWRFRALRELPRLALEAGLLEYLITTGNDAASAHDKQGVMEEIAQDVIQELQEQNLTRANCGDLEKHAYSANDSIGDPAIRNLHVLAGV